MPPLEQEGMWVLSGWLESVWGVAMEVEVRARGGEGNLCSGEFIVVWTDEVTD